MDALKAKKLRLTRIFSACGAALAALLAGCERPAAPPEVVLYTSVDQVFAQGVIEDFQQSTGMRVRAVFDTEAGKTTGFLRRLVREKERPRCDVWWSSEVFGSIELAQQGVFARYYTPVVADVPTEWSSPEGHWNATAARARVLAYHPDRVRREDLPATWRELADSPLVGRMAVANPQFGTTRGHVAAMFAYWGAEPATAYLQKLRDRGVRIADGNAHAVRMLASGQADVCWTDTDDVWSAQRRGERIELIYPRLDEGLPPIWIPCSVALVEGGPNADAGKKLLEYLLSPRVERQLFESDSRNIPVRDALRRELIAAERRRRIGSMPGAQPAAAGTQPAGAGIQPAGAGTQPAAAGTQPAAAGTQPAAAGTQPGAATARRGAEPAPEALDFSRVAAALPEAMEAARRILLR